MLDAAIFTIAIAVCITALRMCYVIQRDWTRYEERRKRDHEAFHQTIGGPRAVKGGAAKPVKT